VRSRLLLLLLSSLAGAQAPPVGPVAPPKSPDENRAEAILSTALEDKNPDVRKQAVAALGLIGPREPYISQIGKALSDKDVYVRLAAVASLIDLKDKGTADTLDKALRDEAPEVSFAAARALFGMDDPRGRAALMAILQKEAKTGSGFLTAQKRDMLRMFHTPKTLMMFAVKQGVSLAPVPGVGEGVSSLEGILSDNKITGRATTALLLANDRSPEVIDALKDALGDKDASVRAAVVHAMALRDDPSLLPLLLPRFDDQKQSVRLRAAAAYLRLAWLRAAPAAPPAPPTPSGTVKGGKQ
jgi:HEAT repeat protein